MTVGPVGAGPAAAAAISAAQIEAELAALAANGAALRAEVTPGSVVTATVLPSNGLTDLIDILGKAVAAALPPTLTPGDTVQVLVTGFNGDQILLQMLDSASPAATGAPAFEEAAGAPTPPVIPPAEPPTPGITSAAPAAANGRPLAPATAVFVAASVRPAAVQGAEPPIPSATPNQALVPAPLQAVEARLAAARAGAIVPTPAGQTPRAPAAPSSLPPSIPRSFVAPPLITASRAAPPAAPGPPTVPAGLAATAGRSAPIPSALTALTDPVLLVRALRLPITPTNLAAAKMAIETPQRLPAALATLEQALPQADDPRVATLRAILGFVNRIDPRSPQLASQISAYVDHVVDGGEPKLAALLAATFAAEPPPESAPAASAGLPLPAEDAPAQAAPPPAPGSPPPPAGGAPAPAGGAASAPPAPSPALAVLALAAAAERGAALSVDLKTQLQSILAAAPPGAGDELVASAATALSAVTGVQLATAQALAANPSSVQFAIPMWLGSSYVQAQVTVDRDAPDGTRTPLDGDNFHIAFLLDTKNVGTVAVDLKSVGRAVTVQVKTEAAPAAQRFSAALGRLTERLEHLRYRVASADASIARPVPAPPQEPAPTGDADDPTAVNLRA